MSTVVAGVNLIVVLLAAAPSQAVLLDRVVAVVDDHAITARVVGERAAPRLAAAKDADERNRALRESVNELVDDFLIARDCDRLKVETTNDEVDRAFDTVKKSVGLSDDAFLAELKKQGMTLTGYRASLNAQLKRMRWVNLRVDHTSAPKAAEAKPGWLVEQERHLIDALRAKASIEVRL